jgi:hypothetical protein
VQRLGHFTSKPRQFRSTGDLNRGNIHAMGSDTIPGARLKLVELVDESYDYLSKKIAISQSEYGLGTYDDFRLDQTNGTLVFITAGEPKVSCRFQAVGSVSRTTDTWLWSWANPDLLDSIKNEVAHVKQVGHDHEIAELTEAKWPAAEADGWSMTAVTARLLGSEGAYRCPSPTSYLFVVLQEISWVGEGPMRVATERPEEAAKAAGRSSRKTAPRRTSKKTSGQSAGKVPKKASKKTSSRKTAPRKTSTKAPTRLKKRAKKSSKKPVKKPRKSKRLSQR